MTIKEIKKDIANQNLSEADLEKANLIISASESFAKDMHRKLEGLALNKKLREFLESDEFAGTIYNIIKLTREANVEAQMKLRSKELKALKHRKATNAELATVSTPPGMAKKVSDLPAG